MKIINPYKGGDTWLKGNLHTHTKESVCGYFTPEEIAAVYTYKHKVMAYDFIAITDHLKISSISAIENIDGFLVFNGTEYKKDKYQTLGINIKSYDDEDESKSHQEIFNLVNAQGGLNIICHPHIYNDDYWPLEKLLDLDGYAAIEIFNYNVKKNNAGRAIATDVWDQLLSKGRRVWGIASDDLHFSYSYGGGFIKVLANKNKEAIINAIKAGAFYSSSGILLENIELKDNTITLSAATPRVPNTVFKFIGQEGKLLKKELVQEAQAAVSYTVKGNEGYVRVEASREDGAQAWTQPFWIE